jgi:hypothetical protein
MEENTTNGNELTDYQNKLLLITSLIFVTVNLTKERLDWFNFETKSRQTTQRLIQPILDQLAEDKKQFFEIRKQSDSQEERLKLLEYVVLESGNK